MFVDASALTAMMTDEGDAPDLLQKLATSSLRVTSPLAVWETALAVARILGLLPSQAEAAVEEFLQIAEIEVRSVPAACRGIALDAFARYGKGRHPPALNFGDCFAYACARHAGLPLLYKGQDFAQTDIEAA